MQRDILNYDLLNILDEIFLLIKMLFIEYFRWDVIYWQSYLHTVRVILSWTPNHLSIEWLHDKSKISFVTIWS